MFYLEAQELGAKWVNLKVLRKWDDATDHSHIVSTVL